MAVAVQQLWDRAPSVVCAYLVVLFIVCVLYILKNFIRSINLALKLNGPPTVPIIGNVHAVLDDTLLNRMAYEGLSYGRLYRVWVTCLPYVVLLEPQDIQLVLGSSKHTRKIFFYKFLDNFLGKGLITRDVETWRIHRKLLQPAFHLQSLEKFITSFAECANDLADKFLLASGKDINFTAFINDSVYEILCETVLGITHTKEVNGAATDVMTFRQGQVMAHYRLQKPWLIFDSIYRLTKSGKKEEKYRQDLFNVCFKMMKAKRDLLRNTNNIETKNDKNTLKRICLLDYLVELNEKNPCFTDSDIVDECCTFMLAGQDSVGTATAMTLFLLAKHPEWQEKCVNELDEIFEEDTRSPTMKDFKEMKVLEMCIKEALRLYPSVPLFARILGEDVKVGKHVIPAGCGVIFMPYSTHRLPDHFPDPHSFKPERFNPQNSEKRHPYAYLPFSAGPRNCIGYKFAMLEMKSLISAVLRKCSLRSIPGKDEIRPKFRVTVRAQGGLWVNVMARNDETDSIH